MLTLIAATLLTTATPAGRPVKVVRYADAKYQFYLQKEQDKMSFKVCVRYIPTGTRIERSSCGSPPFSPTVALSPLLHDFWGFDPHLGYATQARQIELHANRLVADNELSEVDLKSLFDIVRLSYWRQQPSFPDFN